MKTLLVELVLNMDHNICIARRQGNEGNNSLLPEFSLWLIFNQLIAHFHHKNSENFPLWFSSTHYIFTLLSQELTVLFQAVKNNSLSLWKKNTQIPFRLYCNHDSCNCTLPKHVETEVHHTTPSYTEFTKCTPTTINGLLFINKPSTHQQP